MYFAAGVAIAVFAFLGLRQIKIGLSQIKLTKEIASTNAKREALKFAAEQCRYFAETAVARQTEMMDEYNRARWTFFNPSGQPPFVIRNGEIVSNNFNHRALAEEVPKTGQLVINYLNVLEAFAIPFACGVADEEIGYRETARAFCQAMNAYMAAIFYLRTTNAARYESAMKLFVMWNNRLAAEALAPVEKAIGELRKAAVERIKPLEHNF